MKASEEERNYLYMLKKLDCSLPQAKLKLHLLPGLREGKRGRNNGDRRVGEKDPEYRTENRALANYQIGGSSQV